MHDEPEEEIIYVSKTEMKRDMDELQKLGEELFTLNKQQRQKVPMEEELVDALELADRLPVKTEALRRQLQFIGKLMRGYDPEPILAALDVIKNRHNIAGKVTGQYEQLRDELIAKGDSKINELIEQNPSVERQKLRQLVRNAKKELKSNKPGKAFKEIYQYLKQEVSM